MFISTVEGDCRGLPLENEEITWEAVETAIRELDGATRTELMLTAGDDTMMSVGGGGSFFIVWATYDNLEVFNLSDPSGDTAQSVRFTAGGQAVRVSRRKVVPLEVALQAAKAFAVRGELDPSLQWERA